MSKSDQDGNWNRILNEFVGQIKMQQTINNKQKSI